MSLYKKWIRSAYDKDGQNLQKTWNQYIPLETNIYKTILTEKTDHLTGTIAELGERFNMSAEYICGFIEGINEALIKPMDPDEMEELDLDTQVNLLIDFEKLYKKMVEYKAENLYNLSEWDNIFTPEQRTEFYKEQKSSGTIIKAPKPGRNEPCTCGSGKKYKKCCGIN